MYPGVALCGEEAVMESTNLRCEYQAQPIGVEERTPRLTWTPESRRRDEHVTGYRIVVASTRERLDRDEGDLWDSGRVASGTTTLVEYAGKALASRQACHWKVRSWDREGRAGPWSEPARWEMGLLESGDWGAKWIDATPTALRVEIEKATYASVDGRVRKDVTGVVREKIAKGEKVIARNDALGGDPAVNTPKRLEMDYRCDGVALHVDTPENGEVTLASSRIPYLRGTFDVGEHVAKVRLYATALGVYEVFLNGARVGDLHLAPGWTDYRKQVRYQVYDLTSQVRAGKNALGAIVGPGWFSGRAGLFHARAFYGTSPAFMAQLEVTYDDGRVERFVSDASWRRTDGPMLAADMMDGVVYDASREIDGWCSPSLDDATWSAVATREENRTLRSDVDRPVRVLERLAPKSVVETTPGRWVFDLGQNMVGVARLRTRAKQGAKITLRHAEMLNPDGTIYTQNLRGAAAVDTYIAAGGEREWQPTFTFHGFRYVEVSGVDGPLKIGDVEGVVLGSDLERVGTFTCSDDRLNRLQSNILWGLRGNYLSIPTDCPQRDERMGWMADTQVFTPTAAFNADVTLFMMKWLEDVADAQREDGAYPDVAPVMKGLSYGTPAWADAGTFVPWTIYQMTGDRRLLARHVDRMARWVDWCVAHSTGLIRDRDRGNDYGDWLSIGADTPKDMIGTAYFARSAWIVGEAYRVLGREDLARRYGRVFEDVRAAFRAKYVGADGMIAGRTQCGQVLALRFDLLPEEQRAAALRHLVSDIESKQDHLSTGFVGVAHLLPTLSGEGRGDVAYRLLLQDSFPSWLFSVKHGATTIWERWDGWTPQTGPHPDWTMNSFNHYSLGSCGEWLYTGIAGIQPDVERPGFERVMIRPQIGGSLTHARATYASIRGTIESNWRLVDERAIVRVRVPTNTSAIVVLPVSGTEIVRESGNDVEHAAGVRRARREGGGWWLEVGSGEYEFEMPRPSGR